jgi:hypothetical protein
MGNSDRSCSRTLTESHVPSLACVTAICDLGQLSGEKDKIGLQGSPFVFYWWNIRTSLHRSLPSSGNLLRLLFDLLKEASKIESFENSLGCLPRLASLSRIINHCRSSGRILIRRCLFALLLLSRIAGMLVIKLSMGREGNVCKWRGLMGRGDNNLLC